MKAIRLLLASVLLGSRAAFGAGLVIDQSEADAMVVRDEGKPVLVYAHGSNQFKPYIRELYTVNGVNALRDAPADHLHHHGLMFALHVNGVNFWEETKASGRQIGTTPKQATGRSPGGLPQASFSQRLYWVADTNRNPDAAFLTEIRTIVVTLDKARQETAVEWKSDFTAHVPVKLHGTAYNGLGLRLAPYFDKVGRRQNSSRATYTLEGKWDVTPARWSSFAAGAGGTESTVAMFSLPANAGNGAFFSMLNPFAYLSATQGVGEHPLSYRSGGKFSICYLITAHPGTRSADDLDTRLGEWLAQNQKKPNP